MCRLMEDIIEEILEGDYLIRPSRDEIGKKNWEQIISPQLLYSGRQPCTIQTQ